MHYLVYINIYELAMATGHAMLINLHLNSLKTTDFERFEYKYLKNLHSITMQLLWLPSTLIYLHDKNFVSVW
jgi:hypothetical protein